MSNCIAVRLTDRPATTALRFLRSAPHRPRFSDAGAASCGDVLARAPRAHPPELRRRTARTRATSSLGLKGLTM